MSTGVKKLANTIITDIAAVIDLTKKFIKDANTNSDTELSIKLPEDNLVYTNGIEFIHNLDIIISDMVISRDYIDSIDLFNKRSLVSETTKFSLIKNKLLLIELYDKYLKKINNIKNNITNTLADTITIEEINKNIKKYPQAIELFTKVAIKCNNKIKKGIIDYNIKSAIFESKEININKTIYKNYIAITYNYIKTIQIKNELKSYANINELIKNSITIDTDIQLSNDITSKDNINKLNSLCSIYKNNYNKNLSIIILTKNTTRGVSKKDKIQFTVKKLLDSNLAIDSLSGINDLYIEKTKTITMNSKEEYLVLSGISNIYNYVDIYNCKLEDFDRDVLVIDLDSMQSTILDMYDSFTLFTKDVYDIKYKYNNIINSNILENINYGKSEFEKNIDTDLRTFKDANIYDIKNNIMKSIKINKKNTKDKNIDNILSTIFDEIYDYINKKNKINMNDEIYITFYSSIYSTVNKLRKEFVDNYEKIDNGDLEIISTLILKIRNNIIKLDGNVVEKYYLMK